MTKFSLNQAYNRNQFCAFLRSFLDDYSEDIQSVQLSFKSQFASQVYSLGKCRELELEVYEIHHSSAKDARVGIAKDAFKILLHHSFCNRALVVFIPDQGEQWRFSLIEMEAAQEDNQSRITRSYSNPRRHSYLLGKGGSMTTPQKYLFDLGTIHARREGNKELTAYEDLQSRFSVEALTKEFYSKLYNWYLWAIEPSTGLTFPNLVSTSADDRDDIAIKVIRLITRLLFVWFIKQKGLVPADIFDENELDSILANFDPQSKTDGKYYNAILQNLFFATLNNEIGKRRFMSEPFQGASDSYGVKTLFRDSLKASWFKISHDEVLKHFHNVPFMNCGLFECLDKYKKTDLGVEDDRFLDGFSSRDSKQDGHFKYRAFIPNYLFFAPDGTSTTVTVVEDKQTKHVTIPVMGLITLLKLYNFTVQENTPTDMEVSLDPELLGQVFENLLAAYNPETKESARKSTGSFYTPRPIVEYMVNESLVEYLKTKVDASLEDTWRALISYEDKPFELTIEQRKAVLDALYECKVLDPACGSGAFPMGMLQQMVHIIRQVDADNELWKALVLEKAIKSTQDAFRSETKETRRKRIEEVEQAFEESMENPDYTRKLYLIQNCIYGSDIQPIAMLISKLRFFISLICEQEDSRINFADEQNNFGINTLPNLETKFVAANSLLKASIRDYADDDWTNDPYLVKLKNDLLKIRKSHFMVRTQTSKLNKRAEDEAKRKEILDYIIQSTTQPDPIKIQQMQARIEHLQEERKLYEGENIVEEYVDTQASLFEEVQRQLVRRDVNKLKRDRIDSEIKGLRDAITKENNKSNPVGFNAAVKQITDWNPYDQLKYAPFFDPDWMFGIKDGFDIVIGNPPYVQLQSNKGALASLYEDQGYQTFARTGDMYCLFYEQGWKNLCSNGHLCFITSNKWMRAGYGEKTREFFANQTNPLLLIDFAGVKIFESATVDTNILLFEKAKNANATTCCMAKELDKNGVNNLSLFVQQNSCACSFTSSDSWVILSPIEQSIKNKIESVGTPLKEWDIQINYGIKTGFNDAFIISTDKRNELLKACQTTDERQRTKALIRPILRGRDIKRYGYEWANLWLIALFPSRHYDIEQFPTIKQYLLSFGIERLEQTGKKYTINDETITARKKTNNKWFEVQDSISYWADFDKPKIVYNDIAQRLSFAMSSNGEFLNNTAYFIIARDVRTLEYLLKILNSKIIEWYYRTLSVQLGANAVRMFSIYVLQLPIPLSDTNLLNRYGDEYEIDMAIYKLYGLTDNEQDFIENQ